VRDSLLLIRKTFKLRQCENSFFRHRTRPCLQYQINQCSAPCVGFISAEQYAESIAHGILLLEGKNTQLLKKLTRLMTAAASDLAFEKAAQYRDQIARLRRLQEQQHVSTGQGNIDIIGIDLQSGMACVQILCIRQGRMLGGKHYLPKLPTLTQANELLEAFLPSYYLSQKIIDNIPEQLIVSTAFTAANALLEAINDKFGRRIKIISQPKGDKASWLALANTNAAHQLTSHLAGKAHNQEQLYALSQALDMAEPPQRLECFDISHSQGEATVASCVVFKQGGPVKAEYRRFNITQVKAGDDYAAIRQAVARRYGRIVKEQAKLPDIVFIDGGKGQLSQAMVALDELQLGQLLVIAVAKGVERKPGLEVLFTNDGRTLELGADSRALHLVQRIRDEAHRFALTGHRQRRAKGRRQSTLQQIAGVGTKRRQALLTHYGGLKEVMSASAEDLAKVPGISRQMANTIYQHLHDNQ
jgi:excinuclease ABC subunit C